MILLLGLLWSFWTEPVLCLQEDGGFSFDGDIRHFAVSNVSLFISTEEKLYQLSHNLTPIWTLTQRGVLKAGNQSDQLVFHRASKGNTVFTVNLLLPFVRNGSLISCGVADRGCGFCEILDLKNISKILHKEHVQVGPLRFSIRFVGSLMDVRKDSTKTETYILTSIERSKNERENCTSDDEMINLHDTDETGIGGIFSRSDSTGTKPGIRSDYNVEFVDGFQINSTVYLLTNVASGSKTGQIRLLWFEGKTSKSETLKSLHGATLQVSGDEGSRLLASSVIPGGQQVLWSGVFSDDRGRTETQLVLFDISPDLSNNPNTDPHFTYSANNLIKLEPKLLKPKAVILKKNYMSSVLALRQRGWMVFLIGTSDGQLIKVAVDRNYHPTCPKVLYSASEDQNLFPKTHLDPVDQKHVYVPFKNQIKRVPISNCNLSKTLSECWSAQDPFCVWCVSKNSCVFEDDCRDLEWLSIPDEYQQKMVSLRVLKDPSGEMKLIIKTHLYLIPKDQSNFACNLTSASEQSCRTGPQSEYPQCTCDLSGPLPAEDVTVRIRIGQTELMERLKLFNCSNIHGQPSSLLCQQCIRAGCGWRDNSCSWASQEVQNETFCQNIESGKNSSRPEIISITPSVVSFYGKNHALLMGRNLHDVIRVRIQADVDCNPQESPVWNNTGVSLTFHIPRTETKGVVKVCVLLADGSCHSNAAISYQSSPVCTDIVPNSTWISGKRVVTIIGTHLDFVEGVTHGHAPQQVILPRTSIFQNLTYETPAAENSVISSHFVYLKVANQTLPCSTKITYHPDPEFTSFTAAWVGNDIQMVIQKKADQLEITTADLLVWAVQDGKHHPCIMKDKESSNKTDSFTCDISRIHSANIKELKIQYGGQVITLKNSDSLLLFMLLVLLLIPVIVVAVMFFYRSKQKKFTAKMNKRMEDIEIGIRNDIRQGFVDLQTEKADLMENVGAIPFLDYKHFASRIFFPESESLIKLCVKDICQDVQTVQLDECCQGLSQLIQDQFFLTTMVHALEEQKSFTIKDKCSLASLLTVALHSDLSYLTEVMEVLLKDLMQQNSSAQPKLLLRRTESTVEKLLTNWMSICLYGFLRESVGQHLFLLVSALTQQVSKGPVDCVTEKALYTLSENWLLWQAQDFSPLKLKVLFAVGSDGGVSEPLEVGALSCDTVEQLKEKILSTFKTKFGFPYGTGLRDICIEYEKDGRYLPLQDVDSGSEVIREVTKLNTLRHYQVTDGATIKLLSKKVHPPLSPQGSLKDDANFSRKYFHLIDPDEDEAQAKNPEKKKLRLKEVHLTKLLSTKVAIHTYVENLFRSIWSQGRAPHAVKYFFDFLDSQADNMKINDSDVRHIWKTNSLPLRFWVNILKNPQFVFDLEKTPHVDACLSVIAQAFMDSFSLSEIQLGKNAPTNKLLYAKDVPKFKQEVKVYYKQIRDQSPVTDAEFKNFLQGESKKHENEFNEAAALKELYKFIQRYFTEIREKLSQNGAPAELTEQLLHVKDLFDGLKSCSWN